MKIFVIPLIVLAFSVSSTLPSLASQPAQQKAAAENDLPLLVAVLADDHYHSAKSFPPYAKRFLEKRFRVVYVLPTPKDRNDLPNVAAIEKADLLLLAIRRRTLPKQQLAYFRNYIAAGKPVVALRTTSHAFCLNHGKQPAAGLDQWPDFDRQVLGCVYGNHYGSEDTNVEILDSAKNHPVLQDIEADRFTSHTTLYRSKLLDQQAKLLMRGSIAGKQAEPVAWTRKTTHNGRVFYTSLGGPSDLEDPVFQQMLFNALYWARGKNPPVENFGGDN